MVDHDYFQHKNLNGESANDRMKKVNPFLSAGENISRGYNNPMLSHHGLMNSLGHRNNILNTNYTHSFTGVSFDTEENNEPTYTINFFTEKNKDPIQILSEYGFKWHLPSPIKYYQFYLIGHHNHEEIAFYETRQGVSFGGVKVGQTQHDVVKKNGQPLEYIVKNNTKVKQNYLNSANQITHGTYLIEGQYITYFYDPHNKQRIRAILGIDQTFEEQLVNDHGQPSQALQQSNELLMFYLLNQARSEQKLPPFDHNEQAKEIARKHSQFMIDHNVYKYESLNGETSRERLKKANIPFSATGASILRYQKNAIFSVNHLLNDTTDRKNIFNSNYNYIILGVAFNPARRADLVSTLHFYQIDDQLAYPNSELFLSEYGFKWILDTPVNYKNFYLKGMQNNKQIAFYETRQGKNIGGILIGQNFNDVIRKHGQPVKSILRGNTNYAYNYDSPAKHGTYLINGQYITYLYDVAQNQRIRAAIVIDQNIEQSLPGYYGKPSPSFAQASEKLFLHLVNQSRAEQNLKPLSLNTQQLNLVRKHSQDMVDRNFYSTQNPDKQNFSDLMTQANINFQGENTSVFKGASNIIRVHHNLINNTNNLKYMLNPDHHKMLIGVAFNQGKHPSLVSTIAYYHEQ